MRTVIAVNLTVTKYLILFNVLFFGFSMNSNAQILDTFEITKTFFGKTYSYDGRIMNSFGKMKRLMDDDTKAYKIMSHAQTQNTFASVLSFVGGFIVGYQLSNQETNVNNLAIGAGFIVGAIPISISAARKAHKSVLMFNKTEIDRFGIHKLKEIDIKLSPQNIGLVYRF